MTQNTLDSISEASSETSTNSRKRLHVAHKLLRGRVSKFLNRSRRAVSLPCVEMNFGIEFSEKSEFAIPIEQKQDPADSDHPVSNVKLE